MACFQKLQLEINQLHLKHNIDPHMTQLYWQGLQTIWQDTPIDDQLETFPLPYQNLFLAQHDIGWDQLYYGRLSVQWAHQITLDSNYHTNGDLFYMHATSLVWKYLLDCWQLCNQALHNPQDIPPEAHVLAQQAQEI